MSNLDLDFVRSQFPALSRMHAGRPVTYFDGPAGTQVPRCVIDAVSGYYERCNANSHGEFVSSRESDAVVDAAHQAVADLLGADDPDCVAFGPNMTTLTFAFSRALARTWQPGDEVIVTRLDHDANITPWVLAARDAGATVRQVGFHFHDCTLNLDELRSMLNERTKLVAVSAAANVAVTLNARGRYLRVGPRRRGAGVSPKLKDISALIAGADQVHRQNLAAKLDQIESWVKQSREALAQQAEPPAFPGAMPEHPLSRSDRPTAIYNAMVAPLVPYGLRGALWYQGESNNGEGMLYYEKMKALIASWRRLWAQGDFPFLFVQLAPYRYNRTETLPAIWESQQAALAIPNTGMAVLTDIGDVADIHPRNKQEVGRRLSLWALAKTYGVDGLAYSGPVYRSMKVEGNKVVLTFTHAEGLKSLDGKPLTWFSLAGDDKKFVDARAEIQGEAVVVQADSVAKPAAVRFGWHQAEPNLSNKGGLPASPFRISLRRTHPATSSMKTGSSIRPENS